MQNRENNFHHFVQRWREKFVKSDENKFLCFIQKRKKSLWKCNKFYFLFFIQKSIIIFVQTADWQTEESVIRRTLHYTKALKDKSDIDNVTNDKVDNVINVTNVISDSVTNVTNQMRMIIKIVTNVISDIDDIYILVSQLVRTNLDKLTG